MKIQVLGSGCQTCAKFHAVVELAVKQMGENEKVEYLTGEDGMRQIIKLGVMSSPVLTVEGQVAMTGYTSDIVRIQESINKIKDQK